MDRPRLRRPQQLSAATVTRLETMMHGMVSRPLHAAAGQPLADGTVMRMKTMIQEAVLMGGMVSAPPFVPLSAHLIYQPHSCPCVGVL